MRLGLALVLTLGAVSLPGCFTPDADQLATVVRANRLFSGPTGDDVVYLSVALVERPVNDRLLNQDLWELINEQVLDSDTRESLARNGFRLGRVGGTPPPALHALISSERSCSVNPRRIQLHAGTPNTVLLGSAWSKCHFQLDQDGRQSINEFAQATCQLQIVPRLSEGGKVTLRFTPFVKHGDLKNRPVPVRTSSGELQWEMQVSQEEETYSWLAWELTLDANDTVVLGTRPEAENTLGKRCFVQAETTAPVQRMLVLRVGRVPPDPALQAEAHGEGVPLAIQAGLQE